MTSKLIKVLVWVCFVVVIMTSFVSCFDSWGNDSYNQRGYGDSGDYSSEDSNFITVATKFIGGEENSEYMIIDTSGNTYTAEIWAFYGMQIGQSYEITTIFPRWEIGFYRLATPHIIAYSAISKRR